MDETNQFESLALSETMLKALKKKGFEEPTEIQSRCIPLLLKGKQDVVAQAQTGTGKTAAFAIAILEKLDLAKKCPQALILEPTRELAMQVSEETASLKGERDVSVEAIYGGASYEGQFKKLSRGIQVVVGTPGRIQDHIDRGTLDLSSIKFVILDEADEMLDMGFIDDIRGILSSVPKEKRMLLFSATMPKEILSLAESFMGDYTLIRTSEKDVSSALTEQYYYELRESDKMEALCRIIDMDSDFYGVVFCRTKALCEEIGRKLGDRNYNVEALHGDLSQKQRELIMQKMKSHKISILVATDVAARGIDIQDLTHVINYTIPQDPDAYIHRVGRTGRAGRQGVAITFITSGEYKKLAFIKRASNSDIKKGTLPTPDQILEAKRQKMLISVKENLDAPSFEYQSITDALLSSAATETVVRTLLKMLYKNQLDESLYHPVRSQKESVRKSEEKKKVKADKSYTRLFVALGRKDGYTKRTLANLLIEECRVSDEDLQGIQVMDNFSFVNVPSSASDVIIKTFKNKGADGKSLVLRAKAEDGKEKPVASYKSRKRNHYEDEIQFYGRDLRDGEDAYGASRVRKKTHGKYNRKKR